MGGIHGISNSRIFYEQPPEDETSELLCAMVQMTRFVGQQILMTRFFEMGG